MSGMDAMSQVFTAASKVAVGYAGYQSANYNAAMATNNARSALADGASQMASSDAAYRARIGEQAAAEGASGFQMGTGSMVDMLAESRINQTMAALQINRTAIARSQAYQMEAAMQKSRGVNALMSGISGAAGFLNKAKVDYANQSAAYGYGGSGIGPVDVDGALPDSAREPFDERIAKPPNWWERDTGSNRWWETY